MLVATSFEANTAGFDLLGVLSGGAPSVSFSAAASREIILGGANTYTGVTGIGGAGVVKASVLADGGTASRSEEHTSELQSLMRISYAVFCLKKKKILNTYQNDDRLCDKA